MNRIKGGAYHGALIGSGAITPPRAPLDRRAAERTGMGTAAIAAWILAGAAVLALWLSTGGWWR